MSEQALTRRDFIKVLGVTPSIASLQAWDSAEHSSTPTNEVPAPGESKQLPFRHIHLDFHTSPAIPDVGEDFNPDDFAAVLKEASVNSITVFAKCHHGMSYYPTKVGVRHPHLKIDLLGEMIEGCHGKGIFVVAYISTMYDQYIWNHHGDWRVLDENGEEMGLRGKMGPMKAELGTVCVNTPHLDYLVAQAEEVTKNYDVDGMFFDNYLYPEGGCSCAHCMLEREKLGWDSTNQAVRARHAEQVLERGMQKLAAVTRSNKPRGSIFFNGPINFRRVHSIRQDLKYSNHIEIESLPGGAWGYGFFEVAVRYLRNLGAETTGMTGRFHRSWGDFGSIRNQAALDYECFRMLAEGVKCAIGDHLHPRGALNKAVYERIGKTYRSVQQKEPWCEGAEAVTEIGFLTTANYVSIQNLVVSSDLGVTNLLKETHHQFDVLDRKSDFFKYKLIIFPDVHRFDTALLEKVRAYLSGGGKIILSNESGLDPAGKQFALSEMGLDYEGPWPHEVQYVEISDDALSQGLPRMVEVFYEKGQAVKAQLGTKVLGRIWQAYFDRNYLHFQVEQTPFANPTDYVGVAEKENLIYIASPIFRMYAEYAYAFYQQLIANCIRRLLPNPLIQTQAPSTAHITLTQQPGRRIVHILNYVPQRRAPNLDVVQEASPLMNLKLSVRLESRPKQVYLAPQSRPLDFDYADGYTHIEVPAVDGHQMIVFEIKGYS